MHLESFDICQEKRSAYVFSRLEGTHGFNEDARGNPTGKECWHYRVPGSDRLVCREIFQLAYPIGTSTLYSIQQRVLSGAATAHNKTSQGDTDGETVEPVKRVALGEVSVIGWYLGYADTVGDWMPDEQHLVIPLRDLKDTHLEYSVAAGTKDAVAYSTFARVLRDAPEVAHIHQQRAKANFQNCTACMNLNEEVTLTPTLTPTPP